MNELLQTLRADLQNEEGRYIYADTITNAFIAAQIKALQKDRGLTQTELAELMGTKQSGVSRLQRAEYGSWKVETLRKFARAFRVRLRIRFEEFGTLVDEIKGFDNRNLTPKTFEDDPVLSKPKQAKKLKRIKKATNNSTEVTFPRRLRRKVVGSVITKDQYGRSGSQKAS